MAISFCFFDIRIGFNMSVDFSMYVCVRPYARACKCVIRLSDVM